MFARSERIRPWSARTVRWSELRSTVKTLASIVTDNPAGIACESFPFGPSTLTACSFTATFTPAGTGMGFLPTRDMVERSLPDVCEDFAAHLLPAAFPVGHDAAGRGEYRDTHPAENGGYLVLPDIDAPSWPGHTDQPRDHLLVAGPVLEVHAQNTLLLVLDESVVLDEPFVFEELRDLHLEPRGWDVNLLVFGPARVANPGQEIGDRITCHRCAPLSLRLVAFALPSPSYQLALITPGTSPLSANSRKQIRHA